MSVISEFMDNAGDGQRSPDRIEGQAGAYANNHLNKEGLTRSRNKPDQQLGIVLATRFVESVAAEAIDPTPWVNLKSRPDAAATATVNLPVAPMLCHYVAINGGSCVAENYNNETDEFASPTLSYTRIYQLLPPGTTAAGFDANNHRGRPVLCTMTPGRRTGHCTEEDFIGDQTLLDAPTVSTTPAAPTAFRASRRRRVRSPFSRAFASVTPAGGGPGWSSAFAGLSSGLSAGLAGLGGLLSGTGTPPPSPPIPSPVPSGSPHYAEAPLLNFEYKHYGRDSIPIRIT